MALHQWFGDGYHKLNQQQDSKYGMEKLPTQDGQGNWLPDVRCIQAHFHHGHGFGLPYFYPEIDQYVTILRDPFDLMVSMYFFIKGRSKQGKFWFRGRPVDITETYPSIESYVRNYPYWMYSHLPQNLTLANYRQQLSKQFVYIGIFEDLQNSINRLAEKLGQSPVKLPLSNASQYDETVPEELRQQFYFDYPLPKRIYDFARQHYQDDSERWGRRNPAESEVDATEGAVSQSSGGTKNEYCDDAVVCGDMSPPEPS
jgi:hypothetical protein